MGLRLERFAQVLRAPTSWTIKVRRVFVLTFPVAAPLWILMLAASHLWLLSSEVFAPIGRFWNAPPKRLDMQGYYNYPSRSRRSKKVVELDDVRKQRDAA